MGMDIVEGHDFRGGKKNNRSGKIVSINYGQAKKQP
jgi:hypothetical protein